MQERPWWQTGVIYQIYPRSFRDTTGSGMGDLPGVIEKLDYLTDTLGVDAIWLSPFYPSPMKDFGYDVADYTGVDPRFGTLEDFDRLVEAAHARRLKVIVDYVPNHSSDQHPWFAESRSSKDSPKRDWYVWRAPKPGDGPPEERRPNNWLSHFGGAAWTFDEATSQFYLHSFLKEQPDLNWRTPEVQAAMFEAARFWLRRGVDGFRIDVAHSIMKDPALRDNPPAPGGASHYHKERGAYDRQLHLYDKGHPDAHRVYRDFRRLLDEYSDESDHIALGEMHIYDWGEWAAYYGADLDEMQLPLNFALLMAEWNAAGVRAVVDGLEAALPEGAWPNYVLGNHDEPRLATRYGVAQARVAAVLLLTLRGTPTLYYGDELGLTELEIPPERQQDPFGRNVPGLGRDGCRTPMPWTDGPSGGFSSAAPKDLWLPLGENHGSVEAQLEDDTSMLTLYRRLLTLRRRSTALHAGRYGPVDDAPAACFVYRRTADSDEKLVALNLSSAPQEVPLPPDLEKGRVLLSTHPGCNGEAVRETLTLRADEAVVLDVWEEGGKTGRYGET